MSTDRTWTREQLPKALDGALAAAIDRGARAPVVLRLTEVAGYTDWALLVSGRSDRQVRGIVDGIREAMTKLSSTLEGTDVPRLLGADGLDQNLWALLDYDDFLIHVFYHPVRRHYDLESMWSDAPRVELGLPEAILDASDLDGLTAPDPMPDYRGDVTFGGFEDEFVDDDDDDDDDYVDDAEFGDSDLFEDTPAQAPVAATGTEGTAPEPQPQSDSDLFDP